jgi:hypothetical protein
MTMGTTNRSSIMYATTVSDVTDHVLMTVDAVLLQNARVFFGDFNGLMEILQGERPGVKIPIFYFSKIFTKKIMRKVTLNAASYAVMAAFDPGVILWLHNMAIGTHLGI